MKAVVRGILTMLAAVFVAGAVVAQQPAKPTPAPAPAGDGGGRIAFINARAILTGMPGYAKAESLWTKEMEVARGEGQRLQAVFDSAVTNFQQSQSMMTPSNRTAREKQLRAQSDTLQGKLQALQDRVVGREDELLAPMRNRLKAVIEGVRAESNYAMIVDLAGQAGSLIVAYDKSLDITLKVVQRLASSN